jgi:hypothetical protein
VRRAARRRFSPGLGSPAAVRGLASAAPVATPAALASALCQRSHKYQTGLLHAVGIAAVERVERQATVAAVASALCQKSRYCMAGFRQAVGVATAAAVASALCQPGFRGLAATNHPAQYPRITRNTKLLPTINVRWSNQKGRNEEVPVQKRSTSGNWCSDRRSFFQVSGYIDVHCISRVSAQGCDD